MRLGIGIVLLALGITGGWVVAKNLHTDCTPWLNWFKVCGAVITKP